MKVRVINKSNHQLPAYQTGFSAGMDLCAFLESPVILEAGDRYLVPTGLYIELPVGFEAQIRPRSGLALKFGLTVLNSPGTVDADYRGEIKVLLINLGKEPFTINSGERIAQMVVAKHERVEWELTDSLNQTDRGSGGYGSTGL